MRHNLCRSGLLVIVGMALSACVQTSMQGYADQQLPSRAVQRIAVYVSAPGSLGQSLQAVIREDARGRGISADDAFMMLPPTRNYSNTDIAQALKANSIDAVLVMNVGDTGVIREYAGTIFQANYSGNSSYSGSATRFGNSADISLTGTHSGTMVGSSSPVYRSSRQAAFQARLVEVGSGRNLWVGNGQVAASGALFVGDGANAKSAVSAIFDDLRAKGIIAGTS